MAQRNELLNIKLACGCSVKKRASCSPCNQLCWQKLTSLLDGRCYLVRKADGVEPALIGNVPAHVVDVVNGKTAALSPVAVNFADVVEAAGILIRGLKVLRLEESVVVGEIELTDSLLLTRASITVGRASTSRDRANRRSADIDMLVWTWGGTAAVVEDASGLTMRTMMNDIEGDAGLLRLVDHIMSWLSAVNPLRRVVGIIMARKGRVLTTDLNTNRSLRKKE